MGKLRIRYISSQNENITFCALEIASTDIKDGQILLKNMCSAIELAVMLYDAKLIGPDVFLKAEIDDNYPVGACSVFDFNSHEDGVEFIKTILNAFQ